MRDFTLSAPHAASHKATAGSGGLAVVLTLLFWGGALSLSAWTVVTHHYSMAAIQRVGRLLYVLGVAFLVVWGAAAATLGLLRGGGQRRKARRTDLRPASRIGYIRRD